MKKPVLSFKEFIFEQESGATGTPFVNTTTGPKSTETEREAKSRIAASLVKSIFGDMEGLTGGIDSIIDQTKEVKESLPYKGCGVNEPYPLEKKPITVGAFKKILEYLQSENKADYSRTIKELEEGRSVMVGMRNKLGVKKESTNQDRFVDALYFIPQGAKDGDPVIPYQITTAPSLAYYGKKPMNPVGTGIKLPGETLYFLQENELSHGKYKMMVEAEPIDVGRYEIGVDKFDTYKPSKKSKERTGMHIHRSSTKGEGVCVGPWSAGCQVFSDPEEWKDFISKAEAQTNNGPKFLYSLVELDSIPEQKMSEFLRSSSALASAGDKKTKKGKEKPGLKTFGKIS
jgi:hypothetical protein